MSKYKYMLTLLIMFYLSAFPISLVGAYYNKAHSGQGGQHYFARGIVDSETDIILAIYSELANGSDAKAWEFSLTVLPSREDVTYVIDIRDSNHAADLAYETDAVIEPNDAEAIGTRRFGPWSLYAGADYGNLEWHITIYSRDFKEVYIDVMFTWGYSTKNPPEIIGSPDIEGNDTVATSGGISPRVVFLVAISIAIAGKKAFGKSINTKIGEEELIVK